MRILPSAGASCSTMTLRGPSVFANQVAGSTCHVTRHPCARIGSSRLPGRGLSVTATDRQFGGRGPKPGLRPAPGSGAPAPCHDPWHAPWDSVSPSHHEPQFESRIFHIFIPFPFNHHPVGARQTRGSIPGVPPGGVTPGYHPVAASRLSYASGVRGACVPEAHESGSGIEGRRVSWSAPKK